MLALLQHLDDDEFCPALSSESFKTKYENVTSDCMTLLQDNKNQGYK